MLVRRWFKLISFGGYPLLTDGLVSLIIDPGMGRSDAGIAADENADDDLAIALLFFGSWDNCLLLWWRARDGIV